jgi:PAS domain S-box-containing protein
VFRSFTVCYQADAMCFENRYLVTFPQVVPSLRRFIRRSSPQATRFLQLLLFLSVLVGVAPSHAGGNTPIFILHSYSQEYPWTKRQHDGFLRKFGADAPGAIDASVEYLDTKRVPYTAAYAEFMANYLAQKYAGFEPKLIYVTDDNALLFALAHLHRIFPKAPVFFSGVNDYGIKERIDPRRVTGVFENKEIAPNLDLMRRLASEAKDILMVGDESQTYQAIRRDIDVELAKQPNIRVQFLSSSRIEQLVAALKARKERFVFLTTLGAITDAEGRTLTLPETIGAIVGAGRFIVISMEDVYLYPGVLGGFVTSGYKQGAAAAGLGARYLAGTAVAEIRPIEISPNEYIIDGGELDKLGVMLPHEIAGRTTILNPVPTFYERNLKIIEQSIYVFAFLFLASLAGFIYTLLRKNRQIARASKELSAQTERLQAVIGGFPVVLWTVDREGVFTLSRGAGLKALDLSPDEVVGKSLFEIYRDVPTIVAAVRRAIAGETQVRTNWVGDLAFETYYAPLRGASGEVNGAIGVSTDVTEREKAEAALRASEEKFAKAFRSSPMFITISTAGDGRYVDVNEGFLRGTGYTREEVIGRTSRDLALWKHPPTRQRAIDSLRRNGSIAGFEAELCKKSGESMICEIWAEPIEIDKEPCIVWVTNDITERKRAEAELQASEARHSAIFQASPLGIVLRRISDGKILDVNDAGLQMYRTTRDKLVGQSLDELKVYADAAQYQELMRQLRESGAVDRMVVDMRSAVGEIRAVEMSARVIDLQGERCVVAIMLDVTERKRMEMMNLQAQKMQALGTLAGGVAHDFNNIIAAIMGNAELARQDVGPVHAALESLEEIRKASRRAKDLVQQILAFGRKQATERKLISLAPVVEEAGRLLRSTLPAGIGLNVSCEPDAPQVLADATQIEQVLLNLCGNAWQAIAADKQGAMIEVLLRPHEQTAGGAPEAGFETVAGEMRAGRYACITVRDNGSGMDKETLARMFEPFFTTKPVGKGTGLGLAVVHSIAQDHGASIQIRSAPGEGSTFRICLPAAPASASAIPATVPMIAPKHGRGEHILYVDDDEAIVLLMTRLLERQGYRVSGFTDAQAALAAVRADPAQFDLVVTDYNMPGMSGLQVARALKEIRADMPVAMASGYLTDELRQEAPLAGVSELIYKPNTVEDLCAAVARLAIAQRGNNGAS